MQTLFGMDLSTGQKWIIAFAVILVLLALLGLFARQLKGGRLRLRGQGGGRARQPRLGVVDIHDLDRQRQLVLIRRDNVEHLVMIGGASDVVVESNIVRGSQRSAVTVPQDLAPYERPVPFDLALPPEPRDSEEPRRTPPMPEPPPREPARQDVARQEPAKRETARQDPAPPPRQTQPTAADAVSAAAAAAVASGAATALGRAETKPSAPSFTREQGPAPQPSAGELDDMTRQLEAALKRPFSAVRPGQAPVQPSEPLVDITSSRPREEPKVAPLEPTVPAPAPEPRIEDLPEDPIEPVTVQPPREQKPAPLPVDVAAELEMALGLKPEPVAPRPSKPTEPVAPAPQPVTISPPPAPSQAGAPPDDIDDTLDLPAKPSEPEENAPPIAALPDKPADTKEPEKPAEPKELDPFSVEAIEAEFARLLGRDPKAKS